MRRVVDKLVGELADQLQERGVALELSDGAREWLAEHGYDRDFGARPMRRLIDTKIKRALADEILFGKLQNGGSVLVKPPEDQAANKDPQEAEMVLEVSGDEISEATSEPKAETEPDPVH